MNAPKISLNEIEFYQECRLSFGIDFDERLANFNLTNIDEYINKYYVEDTFKNNASEDRFCKYLLSDMIDCFKTDRDTRKLYPCNKVVFIIRLEPFEVWERKSDSEVYFYYSILDVLAEF